MDDIGIDDDFVRLGGDSLKAIKAVSLIDMLPDGVRIPV